MRKVLAKVDDARLGRAIAGFVTRALVVERVEREGGAVRAVVRSTGKRGEKVYKVGVKPVGRGFAVFCSCEDWGGTRRALQAHRGGGAARAGRGVAGSQRAQEHGWFAASALGCSSLFFIGGPGSCRLSGPGYVVNPVGSSGLRSVSHRLRKARDKC